MATRRAKPPATTPARFPARPLDLDAHSVEKHGLVRAALDVVAADPSVIAARALARTAEERATYLAWRASLTRRTVLAYQLEASAAPF